MTSPIRPLPALIQDPELPCARLLASHIVAIETVRLASVSSLLICLPWLGLARLDEYLPKVLSDARGKVGT